MPHWVWGPASTELPSSTHSRPHSFLKRRRARPARECRMWELIAHCFVAPQSNLPHPLEVVVLSSRPPVTRFCRPQHSTRLFGCPLEASYNAVLDFIEVLDPLGTVHYEVGTSAIRTKAPDLTGLCNFIVVFLSQVTCSLLDILTWGNGTL